MVGVNVLKGLPGEQKSMSHSTNGIGDWQFCAVVVVGKMKHPKAIAMNAIQW